MLVVPIASTFLHIGDDNPIGYQIHYDGSHGIDQLAEVGGRVCYQSFGRPNPATATNKGYLKNILDQGHFSVLEHGSVSFYVEGVSRALLTELTRHRHLSFSVISQRYVGPEHIRFVLPPAIREISEQETGISGEALDDSWQETFSDVLDDYITLYDDLRGHGLSVKQAREAARAVLPNCTEVKMVVTGNIRAWRDVLTKRYHEAADAEIREFATEVLAQLREYAPNALQDIPEVPYA